MSDQYKSPGFRVLGIEHIGIALNTVETSHRLFHEILGIDHSATELIKDQRVTTEIYNTGQGKIELLTAEDDLSPVTRFLDKRGPGMHHLALRVDDIQAALAACRTAGLSLIDEEPRVGAEGLLIAFIHPGSTGGILLELCQNP